MSKIMLSGFYGAGNVGDEAILEAIVKRIKTEHKDVQCYVISKNQMATKRDHNVETLGRNDFAGFFKSLLDTDVLISGGGSLLQDVTSKKSLAYYLGVIFSGVILRKKVMIYSHGIGPINSKFYRKLVRFLLNRVDCITVREENSKLDLIEMKVNADKIYVTADPVIDFNTKDIGSKDRICEVFEFDPNKPVIGISIKSAVIVNTEEKLENFRDMLKTLSMSYNVLLIPFYFNEDIKVINKILGTDFLEEINTGEFAKVKHLDREGTYKEVLEIVSSLDLLVGERLHSLIFAAVANVPFIGISYDPKIDYFLESVDCKSIFEAKNFCSEALKDQIDTTIENEIAFKEKLSYNVQRLKKKLEINDDLLKNLLSEG